MSGWIKLHRKLQKWEWYQDSKMVHLFIHLLFEANYEDKKWMGVEIKRGQFATGLKALNKSTGISIQSLRTSLMRLERTGEINRLSNNQFTVITICNYESYQFLENEATSNLTNEQQATNKRTTTTKNIKKPTIEEIRNFVNENNYNLDAKVIYDHYNDNDWHNSKGKKVINWKSTIRKVWFKPENKKPYRPY